MNHPSHPGQPSRLMHRNLRQPPPMVGGASGLYVHDRHGKRYLDASGGAAVSSLGHGHPEVLAAMHAQIDRNASTRFSSASRRSSRACAK